jgi:outer membrane protein OmpA-like peptidoglycan-associated protein
MRNVVSAALIIFILVAGLSAAAEPDVKGGKDHPLISRMPDFHITEYKSTDFDSYRFIGQDKKQVAVEGHKYVIRYGLDKGAAQPGELKIRRNIQEALKKIGGTVIFDDNFNRVSTIVLRKDGSETWIEVRSLNHAYVLTIVEKQAMKQEVTANAEAMGSDIDTTGHVSVYGIYFDTGRSEVKPESDAAIAEIAKLLKGAGTLKLYVVGHTDNVGSLDSNMKLSKDRAEAVARALTGRHGIGPERLRAYGVASLAPVASNDTEAGRAKNRRVELVKQ